MDTLPLLHYWVTVRLKNERPDLSDHKWLVSFLELCQRCYWLHMLSFSGADHFRVLLEKQQAIHHNAFAKAYGEDCMKPKHHFSLHVPKHVSRVHACLDTKTCERKHQVLKREVESTLQNLQFFEGRLLCKLLQTQVHEINGLDTPLFATCLLKPIQCGPLWKAQQLHLPGNFILRVSMPVISVRLDWAGVISSFEQKDANIYIDINMYTLQTRTAAGIYLWKTLNTCYKMEWHSNLCVTPRYYRLAVQELITVW